jgi:hypothetical protein
MNCAQNQFALRPAISMLAMLVLLLLAQHARAQAVPAGETAIGSTTPAEQPLPGQTLGSTLTLNQGVNAINAENQSFDRFGLGLMAQGGGETNFLGTQTNQVTTSYMEFGADAGVQNTTARTQMFLLYEPQYNLYPSFSTVNNFSQREFSTIAHTITPRLGFSWSTTAARYLSLNQYLPQTLGIGGINVTVPTLGSELLQDSFELTNAATVLNLKYLWTSRLTFTGSLTGGFFLLVPADLSTPNTLLTERLISTGADFNLEYLLTPKSAIGAELTPVYIYGLQPGGHELAETLQVTYSRQLTSTIRAQVAAGPLFLQSSSSLFGSVQATSYAVNASVSKQLKQSQFSAGYSRALLVNLLSPAIVSSSFTGTAYLPFHGNWIYSGTANYSADTGNATVYGTGYVVGVQSQLAYQVRHKFQLFAQYSAFSENFTPPNSPSLGFTRSQFGGGIRFNLGNPMTSGGFE